MIVNPLDKIRERLNDHTGSSKISALRSAHGTLIREKTSVLAEFINQWWTRLLQAVYQGSLSEQEAEYLEHETGRDYVWNTVGTTLWGMVFPLLTIITTQLAGIEEAGMFSMAFVTGTLLMIGANYGVRTYQVSDLDERASFTSYQAQRALTSIAAVLIGLLYMSFRAYDEYMTSICIGIYFYKVIDALGDVYEGRLQQADKLYLAGISQALRSGVVIVAFTLVLIVTRNLGAASIGAAIVAAASLIIVTIPLALFETDKSRKASLSEVSALLRQCFPLAAALLLFSLIDSMPKFVMEGALAYENQLYFNALYFPAQAILLTTGFIYKPQLVRLASIWANPRRRARFDLIVVAMCAVICVIVAVSALFMGWLGIPLMSLLYGVDFEPLRPLAYLMIIAGGITAAIDFLYAIITVLRRSEDVTKIYLVTFVISIITPLILVHTTGLAGATISYLAVMALLLVLLIVDYVRIRRAIARARNPFHSSQHAPKISLHFTHAHTKGRRKNTHSHL